MAMTEDIVKRLRYQADEIGAPVRIVAAAIKLPTGVIAMVETPGRHHDVIHRLADGGWPTPIRGEQGFVTDGGEFVGRKFAMTIARDAGQLISRKDQHGPDGDLFSEDVW